MVAIGPPTGHELRYRNAFRYPSPKGTFELMIFRTSRLVGYVSVPWKIDTPHPAITCDSQGNYHLGRPHRCYQRSHRPQRRAKCESGNTFVSTPTVKGTFKKMSSAPHPTKQTMLVACWFSDKCHNLPFNCLTLTNETICHPVTSEFATQAIPPYRFYQSASGVTYDRLTG